MSNIKKAVIIQTAFLGDVVLTLPLIQELKNLFPQCLIDVMVIPKCAEILLNHPSIHEIIVYDKRGNDSGIGGVLKLGNFLRTRKYDVAFIPHRSLRSALLPMFGGIPMRIGFTTGSGKLLYSHKIPYQKESHEVNRNLALLQPFGYTPQGKVLPSLYPSQEDAGIVERFLQKNRITNRKFIAIAPGTVWNTKRWLPERFAELASDLIAKGYSVVLIGGKDDNMLAQQIANTVNSPNLISAVGMFSILQSAELLRQCSVLVTNDSAPMHLAVSMRTPLVAIFGATVPQFGFAPIGDNDVVVETNGLKCRPCSIHGGNICPIKTFDCMNSITAKNVLEHVLKLSAINSVKQT